MTSTSSLDLILTFPHAQCKLLVFSFANFSCEVKTFQGFCLLPFGFLIFMMRRSSEVCYVMKQLVLLCCPLHATVGLGYCGILVFIFFHTILACFLEALTFRDGYEVHYVHIDLGQTSTKVERFWQVPLSCLLFSWCEWGGGQLVQERCGLHHCLAHLLTISPSLI